eukprot:TRINITY_DN7883_c0_g1_i1.p1 TRINITY_DN7883_c0_g1~~TRINITY_DN7883_c0_g1_i1.p1  ORF type:complete len:725 (+),score=264.83 TRINITY_DN7883_c0_g1_i1:84-2258(+)
MRGSAVANAVRGQGRAVRRPRALPRSDARSFNFASEQYYKCFGNLPSAERSDLTEKTLKYLSDFDPQKWHDEPVTTIIDGERLTEGELVDTVDAFKKVNGKQIVSPDSTVDKIVAHCRGLKPGKDYREGVRKAEAVLETRLSGALIGNQARDFHKQDGITEIEESVQANAVERRLSDLLAAEEAAGRVVICRDPAIVGCVSNFSNFLDLFRKVIRNIELGVPVIVLSRENTGQHMFRWAVLLIDLLKEFGVPPGLVTYASMRRPGKQRLMGALPNSPSYFTCSREVAAALKKQSHHVMASTEGPNTLVASELTPEVAEATKLSNLIENKGQCTALRHAVIPGATAEQVSALYDDVKMIKSVDEAISRGAFADILEHHTTSAHDPPEGYSKHPKLPVAIKVSPTLPGRDLSEQWRQVYIDVTSPPGGITDAFVTELCQWLNDHQPISCALNVPWDVALRVFDHTGLVVNTVGVPGQAAYTCQARPQDGECFGEFPPRGRLTEFTKFPVHIPSPTPGYHSTYSPEHLAAKAAAGPPAELSWCAGLVDMAQSTSAKGYLVLLLEYVADVCKQNPKQSITGPRSALFGLQRPPLGTGDTVIRVGKQTSLDTALASIVPLAATNARDCLVVSVDPQHPAAAALQGDAALKGRVAAEDDAAYAKRAAAAFNAVNPDGATPGAEPTPYPLAAQWVSILLPLGHVKSVRQGDTDFFEHFKRAEKWLRLAAAA